MRALEDCLEEVHKNVPSLSDPPPSPHLSFRGRLGTGASGDRPVPESSETKSRGTLHAGSDTHLTVSDKVHLRMFRAASQSHHPMMRIPRSPSPNPRKPPQPFWDHDSVGARGTRQDDNRRAEARKLQQQLEHERQVPADQDVSRVAEQMKQNDICIGY